MAGPWTCVKIDLMVRHDPTTIRRARTLSRIVGALVGMLMGIFYGLFIISNGNPGAHWSRGVALVAVLGAGVAFAASMALGAPIITVEPFLRIEKALAVASLPELLGAVTGLLVALAISALVAVLLSPLPWGIGVVASICLAGGLVYVGAQTGWRRRDALIDLFSRGADPAQIEPAPQDGTPIVVDTSALIDGRITDVVATGFVQGRLMIPGFVLEELQRVADSGDALRRARGKRGLTAVETLRNSNDVVCEFTDLDFPGTPEVDSRLIRLARVRGAGLLTTDFNLNRIARIEGIRVLNLNDLANALKPMVAAGETLRVTIVKAGRGRGQGVGYLDDGTMVVIENGHDHLDVTVEATVNSVLQTPAGRMIFATLPAGADDPPSPGRNPRLPRAAHRGGV